MIAIKVVKPVKAGDFLRMAYGATFRIARVGDFDYRHTVVEEDVDRVPFESDGAYEINCEAGSVSSGAGGSESDSDSGSDDGVSPVDDGVLLASEGVRLDPRGVCRSSFADGESVSATATGDVDDESHVFTLNAYFARPRGQDVEVDSEHDSDEGLPAAGVLDKVVAFSTRLQSLTANTYEAMYLHGRMAGLADSLPQCPLAGNDAHSSDFIARRSKERAKSIPRDARFRGRVVWPLAEDSPVGFTLFDDTLDDDFSRYVQMLFPLILFPHMSPYHLVFENAGKGDCLFFAVSEASQRLGISVPKPPDLRVAMADLMITLRGRRMTGATGAQFFRENLALTCRDVYWRGSDAAREELVDSVWRGYGRDLAKSMFRSMPGLRTYMSTLFDSEDPWSQATSDEIAQWYSFVARRGRAFQAFESAVVLPILLSMNVILYVWTDGGNRELHFWRRTMTSIIDRDLPTIILLHGRDSYDHFESVEWGFGDPLHFFSFHRCQCPFDFPESTDSPYWCLRECTECAMRS
jgi:hypothetical protein